jgi:D-alanine transfer protein
MRAAHLRPAAAAVFVFVVLSSAFAIHVRSLAARRIHALAPLMFAQKNQGAALQRLAFRSPDLLPVYGSSELNVPNRFHPSAVFRDYPTGFTVFPVGGVGSTCLNRLQALGAVGADLRGRKLVLPLSIRPFMNEAIEERAYIANFSVLHASEVTFSTRLSFGVKQAVARRMLQYQLPLAVHPLLAFAIARLADGSALHRLVYYAVLPLGKLHNAALRLRDDWGTLAFVEAQPATGTLQRREGEPDWPRLLEQANDAAAKTSTSNSFGFDDPLWPTVAASLAGQDGDRLKQSIAHGLERSAEWTDLGLLLRIVAELGGDPLILGIPLKGPYYDSLAVPLQTRQAFYRRLDELGRAHGAEVVTFAEHDSDRHFTVDSGLHLSGAGWVHHARAMNAFFHGKRAGAS